MKVFRLAKKFSLKTNRSGQSIQDPFTKGLVTTAKFDLIHMTRRDHANKQLLSTQLEQKHQEIRFFMNIHDERTTSLYSLCFIPTKVQILKTIGDLMYTFTTFNLWLYNQFRIKNFLK